LLCPHKPKSIVGAEQQRYFQTLFWFFPQTNKETILSLTCLHYTCPPHLLPSNFRSLPSCAAHARAGEVARIRHLSLRTALKIAALDMFLFQQQLDANSAASKGGKK
jgi:hypothetical protein